MKARYTYRFYPTDEQKQQLARTFGCCRYVWNWALALKLEHWKSKNRSLSINVIQKKLTQLKKEQKTSFLSEVSSVPLQQELRRLDRAYTSFFRKQAKYPKFKSKKERQSTTYTRNGFSIDCMNTPQIKLRKQKEPLNIVWSRPLPSKPSSLTIIKESDDRYFISFVVEIAPEPFEKTNQAVGIDLGLNDIAVTSDGWKSGNPKYFTKSESKLKREQRKLSRKQKGSANYEKQRKKVARFHSRIIDQRKDFLHKLSTDFVQRYDVICVESLAVKNMVKNHSLAQAISDAGWGMFVNMLELKCKVYDKQLIRINKWYPSTKTCSECWSINEQLTLADRQWTCSDCGTHHDRDINAAKVIKAVGMAVSACGENVSPSQHDRLISEKQELIQIREPAQRNNPEELETYRVREDNEKI